MNNTKIWEKFFECDCHTEGIMVSGEYHDDLPSHPIIDLAYWNEGYDGRKLDLQRRIRFAWKVLRTGKPWHDMITINKGTAKEIGEFLLSFSKE